MGNWNNPTLSSTYTSVLDVLKERDVDAATLVPGTNIPTNTKKWDTGANVFQNWNGASFDNLILAVAGGGTGSSTAGGARTNLGLGTLATQNSNNVSISGGTITGVNIAASAITSGEIALNRGGTGASLVLGSSGAVLQSNGSAVVFGTNGAALTALNASNISTGNLAIARMPVSGTWTLSAALSIVGASVNIGARLVVTTAGIVAGTPTGGDLGAGNINAGGLFIDGVAVGGTSIPTGMIAIFDSACPSGWTRVSAYDDKFLRGNSTAGGTGGADTHVHGVNLDTDEVAVPDEEFEVDNSGINPPVTIFGLGDEIAGKGAHLHNTTGDTASASSLPAYINVLFCKKD